VEADATASVEASHDSAAGADDVAAVADGLKLVLLRHKDNSSVPANSAVQEGGSAVGTKTVAGDDVPPKSAVALGATEDSNSLP